MNYEKPDLKAITGWRIGRLIGLIIFLVLGIAASIVVTVVDELSPATLWVYLISGGIVLLNLLGLLILPGIEYRQWKYLITDEKVEIVHGIFFVTTSIVPIVRIQHITVGQGPIYRKLGLFKVTIALASGTFEIVGLRDERAREISETLRARLYTRLDAQVDAQVEADAQDYAGSRGGVRMIRFGPKRSHPLIIFNNFFKSFGLLIALLAFCLFIGDFSMLYDNLALPVIVLVGPITRLFNYLFTQYTIDDEKLFIEKGLFNRQKIELPLNTITSVDFSQSILFQATGIYLVNVENSASLQSNQTKVQFALKSASALEAKSFLLGKQNEGKQQVDEEGLPIGNTLQNDETILSRRAASFGEIILLGLLQAKALVIFQVLSVAAVVITFGSQLFFKENIDGDQYLLDWFLNLKGLQVIIIAVVVLYVAGILVSVFMSSLKYFGFCVTNRSDSVFVEYGLLTRKTHTIMKNKISGVNYKQPFLMKPFNMGTLYVFVAGFSLEDDNAPKDAMLFPLMRRHELQPFLEQHIPGITVQPEYHTPEKKALPYFFICPRFVFSVLFLAACVAIGYFQGAPAAPIIAFSEYLWMVGLAVLVFTICSVILEYRHTGIYSGDENVSLTYGGYTQSEVTLLTAKVESIREHASLSKKSKNITSVLVSIMAAPTYANHRVRNVSLGDFRLMESILKY
jgi:putative membrane protein